MEEERRVFPSLVELNVGGVFYTTRLSTLLQHERSMLAAMFSGRYEIQQDRSGRYFIDRDGEIFWHVLEYLRDGIFPSPPLSPADAQRLMREAKFYQLDGLVEYLSLQGTVLMSSLLDLCRKHLGDEYVSFREALLARAIELARSSRSPRSRPISVFSPNALCCRGEDVRTPRAAADVISALPDDYVSCTNVDDDHEVDFVCPLPSLLEWKEILIEDYRLQGHQVTIKAKQHEYCQGMVGNYGDESCERRSADGNSAIIGTYVEVTFGAFWGKDCIHSQIQTPASPSSSSGERSRSKSARQDIEEWLSGFLQSFQASIWPSRSS